MQGYLRYVLRRTLFVLGCLGAGIVGWPGLVGAQESLLNFGEIDASGARRITVTPSAPARGSPQEGGFGAMVSGLLGGLLGKEDLSGAAVSPLMDTVAPLLESGGVSADDLQGIDPGAAADLASALNDLPATLEILGEERGRAIARAADIGTMMTGMDRAAGETARARRLKVAVAEATRPRTEGERLFAEFGLRSFSRTPYEVSLEAMERGR